MKGDFTRLTFRPEKHYTSVRMQQGRLQLDSDWNEQADIQAHLYQTQVVDLIGAASGVPTIAENNQPYKDSFKLSKVSDSQGKTDLAIAPGHCYVNGTLCELEGTPFSFERQSTNQVSVSTLSINGRNLSELQWVEIYKDEDGKEPKDQKFLQIKEVNNLVLTLSLPDGEKLPKSGQMRRVVTYYTQPDYPLKPATDLPSNGLNLAYLDVWQRHITTIEDPEIREVALNVSDTTTRSKTVWQLKLEPFNKQLIEKLVVSNKDKDELLAKRDALNIEALNQSFEIFLSQITAPDDEKQKWTNEFKDQEKSFQKFRPLLSKIIQNIKQDTRKVFDQLVQFSGAIDPLAQSFDQLLDKASPEDQQKWGDSVKQFVDSISILKKNKQQFQESFTPFQNTITTLAGDGQQWLDRFNQLLNERWSNSFNQLLKNISTLEKNKPTENDFTKFLDSIKPSQEDRERWLTNFKQLVGSISALEQIKPQLQQDLTPFLSAITASVKMLQKIMAYEKDELAPESFNSSEWQNLIKAVWQNLLNQLENRRAYMNACARLCPASSSTASSGNGYRRLENQLYRVEIHDPGKVGTARFKWSRDNGSIVSAIEKFQRDDGIITIRKSSQDAWSSSQAGQWIEILDEESELKGKAGVLVSLINVSDTKIKFNPNSIRAASIPECPTKVRRWDYITTREEAITTSSEWIELEAGIKVKFDKDSEYQTGDYWLIPARATIDGIDWPNNQSEREPLLLSPAASTPNPLFQPQKGIYHDYFLLGAVAVKDHSFQTVESDANLRNIFLSLAEVNTSLENVNQELAKKVDKAYVDGELAKKVDKTYVDGELAKKVDKTYVDGELAKKADQTYVDGKLIEKADKTYVDNQLQGKANKTGELDQDFKARDLQARSLKLDSGEQITSFSKDGNLTGGNTAVPTDEAVTTYVKAQLDNVTDQLNKKADKEGNEDFRANTLKAMSIQLNSSVSITNFSNDPDLTGGNADSVPTEQAIKTYITNQLNLKADKSGRQDQDFQVRDLRAANLFASSVATDSIDSKVVLSGSVKSNGFTQISSRSLKDKITDLTSQEVTEVLKTLSPVKFVYTEDATQHLNVGFIAEDTPALLTSPDKQAVKILDVIALLTKAVKDQQAISEELSQVISDQRSELEQLRGKVRELEERQTENPQTIASFAAPPNEPLTRRSPRTSQRARWSLYRNLKRFIRYLFNGR